MTYGGWFYRFLISVLWRNLAVDLDERGDIIHPEFRAVEEDWRCFLLEQQPLNRFSRVHVFVADIPLPGSPRHAVFLTRDCDFSVVTSRDGSIAVAVYAKFANFVIWAEITPREPSEWINTLVIDGTGHLPSGVQRITDRSFGGFLLDRAETRKQRKAQLFTAMSDSQREKLDRWKVENADRLGRSELYRAMRADSTLAAAPHFSVAKVRRNEACPCGSGKKYKKCHGVNA